MKSLKPFAAVLIAALALSACAKKDSDFAAKYKTNKMGAEAANVEETAAADALALAAGVDIDIVAITRATSSTEKVVTSTVVINNYQVSLTTRHAAQEIRTGQMTSGNVTITASAVCALASCNPYYVSIQIYKDNKLLMQQGVRKYFDANGGGSNTLDRYAKIKPEDSIPLTSGSTYSTADLTNDKTIVGYLNTNSEYDKYIK